jgi:hypothetical protein
MMNVKRVIYLLTVYIKITINLTFMSLIFPLCGEWQWLTLQGSCILLCVCWCIHLSITMETSGFYIMVMGRLPIIVCVTVNYICLVPNQMKYEPTDYPYFTITFFCNIANNLQRFKNAWESNVAFIHGEHVCAHMQIMDQCKQKMQNTMDNECPHMYMHIYSWLFALVVQIIYLCCTILLCRNAQLPKRCPHILGNECFL